MAKINAIGNQTASLVSDGNISITSGHLTVSSGNVEITGGAAKAHVIQTRTSSDANCANLDINKSRAGSTITTGDVLGAITFSGHDGSSFVESAKIEVVSTGIISTGVVPCYTSIYTTSTAGAYAERVRVSSEGTVTVNAPVSGYAIEAQGNISTTNALLADDEISTQAMILTGDLACGVGEVSYVSTTDFTANSTGTFTIKSKNANNLDSSGFVKVYVGATPYWLPAFSSPTP